MLKQDRTTQRERHGKKYLIMVGSDFFIGGSF